MSEESWMRLGSELGLRDNVRYPGLLVASKPEAGVVTDAGPASAGEISSSPSKQAPDGVWYLNSQDVWQRNLPDALGRTVIEGRLSQPDDVAAPPASSGSISAIEPSLWEGLWGSRLNQFNLKVTPVGQAANIVAHFVGQGISAFRADGYNPATMKYVHGVDKQRALQDFVIGAATLPIGGGGSGIARLELKAAAQVGETAATRTGKAVHRMLEEERVASGGWSLVNKKLVDAQGNPILVTKRVNLKTGEPVSESGYQVARPDAVSFERGLILDDKPLGRPISKDRQEILRFIRAYEESQGVLPTTIGIPRYDPATGKLVYSEIYKPSDFMPWTK